MHHSDKPDPELKKVLDESTKRYKLGATGKFPQGKLHEADEGELRVGVTQYRDTVLVNFGKSITYIGLDPDSAEHFSKLLRKAAKKARRALGGN